MTKVAKIKEEAETQPAYAGLNIYQRLFHVMQEVDYVQKSTGGGLKYSVVTHDAVTAKVRPVLLKWGVIYPITGQHVQQDGNRTEAFLKVKFVCVDKPDDFLEVQSFGYGVDTGDKGPGKAVSYAVKYALLKTLGLETGDDADLDQAVEHKPKGVEALGGSVRKEVKEDTETVKTMYNQALALLNNVATTEKLKEIWTAQYKGRTVYSEEQWHDIELAKERAKEEIEQGVR